MKNLFLVFFISMFSFYVNGITSSNEMINFDLGSTHQVEYVAAPCDDLRDIVHELIAEVHDEELAQTVSQLVYDACCYVYPNECKRA